MNDYDTSLRHWQVELALTRIAICGMVGAFMGALYAFFLVGDPRPFPHGAMVMLLALPAIAVARWLFNAAGGIVVSEISQTAAASPSPHPLREIGLAISAGFSIYAGAWLAFSLVMIFQ